MIEVRKLADLRPHPENESIFGQPTDSPEYERILKSIKSRGLDEPIVIRPDGTILAGHLRVCVMRILGHKDIKCRVRDFGGDYYAELRYVVGSNTDRRHLIPEQIAWAFDRLTKLSKAQGGTAKGRGGDRKSARAREDQSTSGCALKNRNQAADDAAELLGVGRGEAVALQAVFTAPDVPAEVKAAVNSGALAPTPAAKTIKSERKRQGGEIKDAAPIRAWMDERTKPKEAKGENHADHVKKQADSFQRDMAEMVEVYKRLHAVVSRRPLTSVTGPTEHHEYTRYLRDVALLAWGQVESVTGDTKVGKQMALQVIEGGRS